MKRETGVNPVRARRCKNGVSVKFDIHWIFPGRKTEMLRLEPEDLPAMNDDNHAVLIYLLVRLCPFYQYKKGIFCCRKYQCERME